MPNMVELIKKAAIEAMKESNPVRYLFGTVVSADPLKINIEQKLTLDTDHLVLTDNVRDYDVDMTVDHLTENTSGGAGESSFASHNHAYVGKKTFRVHNGLVVGEKVLLVQIQGGQKYVVLNRVVDA